MPPIIDTNHIQAGSTFGRRGSRTTHQSTDNSVGYIPDVSINGQSYNGYILMSKEPNSPEGCASYGDLYILWLTGYLH